VQAEPARARGGRAPDRRGLRHQARAHARHHPRRGACGNGRGADARCAHAADADGAARQTGRGARVAGRARARGSFMTDYPSLDFALGETIDMLRETVRAFAQDEIAPRAAAIDHANEFPSELWRKLGDLGLLGITVEDEYGGSGLGYLAHIVAMEEIS